jgi:hypothetical protein
MMGGLLSVASLLGGANSLSSTLTGKSLLEHAGIKNPFENLFSSGSSGDGALPSSPPNPFSNFFSPEATQGIVGNTPLDRIQNLFGSGPMAQREALTQALHPTGGIGDIAGLPYQDVGAGLPVAPPGGTAPLTDVFGPPTPATQAGMDVANLPVFDAPLAPGTPTAGPYGPNPAFTEAALNTIMPGYGTTLGAASAAAGMSPALTGAYMTGAIPEFAGAAFGAGVAPTTGLLGAGGGGSAAGLGAMGAAGPLALAAGAYMLMKMRADASKDPTISTRRAQGLEKTLNTGGIGALAEFAYGNPDTLNLLDQVAMDGPGSVNTAPFGTAPTSGGTEMIAWSPENKVKVKAAIEQLQAAHNKGQQVKSYGPDQGLHGAVPSYADAMSGATWNAQNDPFGRRELEAASMKAQGYGNYTPSSRNLKALATGNRSGFASDGSLV